MNKIITYFTILPILLIFIESVNPNNFIHALNYSWAFITIIVFIYRIIIISANAMFTLKAIIDSMSLTERKEFETELREVDSTKMNIIVHGMDLVYLIGVYIVTSQNLGYVLAGSFLIWFWVRIWYTTRCYQYLREAK